MSALEALGAVDDLVIHLERTMGISPAAAARVIAEVLAYFEETPEQFVRRRHHELRGQQIKNETIFAQLTAELQQRRFAAPPLSRRQIRRLIYG